MRLRWGCAEASCSQPCTSPHPLARLGCRRGHPRRDGSFWKMPAECLLSSSFCCQAATPPLTEMCLPSEPGHRAEGGALPYLVPSFLHSWPSLVAQLVESLPAMRESWVQPLGWEDPLEKERATHSSILAWKIHGQSSLTGYSHGVSRVRHNLATKPAHKLYIHRERYTFICVCAWSVMSNSL